MGHPVVSGGGLIGQYNSGTVYERTGYSNPLLFLFIALLRLIGVFDPITTHTKLELLAFTTMSLLVYEILRARCETRAALLGAATFVVLELVTPATWLWYACNRNSPHRVGSVMLSIRFTNCSRFRR